MATLLVALILVGLSLLYGDVVLLHLWFFLPLPWLHGRHSPGLHGELSSSVLHGDLSSVLGGLPGLLEVTGAVCPLAVWLCIAGVGFLLLCRSCLL